MGDPDFIPGSGSSPGEGTGNSLHYFCLENPWTELHTIVGSTIKNFIGFFNSINLNILNSTLLQWICNLAKNVTLLRK